MQQCSETMIPTSDGVHSVESYFWNGKIVKFGGESEMVCSLTFVKIMFNCVMKYWGGSLTLYCTVLDGGEKLTKYRTALMNGCPESVS